MCVMLTVSGWKTATSTLQDAATELGVAAGDLDPVYGAVPIGPIDGTYVVRSHGKALDSHPRSFSDPPIPRYAPFDDAD
jgi:hypothetical protein